MCPSRCAGALRGHINVPVACKELNRNVLKKWRMELLCSVLGTHTITMSCYYHNSTVEPSKFYTADKLTDKTDCLPPHTCAHRVTATMTQLHEKWEDNCRWIPYYHHYILE